MKLKWQKRKRKKNAKESNMIKNILKRIIYIALLLYLLMLFAGIISSGAVIAIVFAVLIIGYVIAMFISIKSARRLEKLKEKVLLDCDYVIEKSDKPLLHVMIANLPFYYVYFAFSLLPMDFPALWLIAGFPCCLISALRPLNKNYQVYNFITNKSKLYWWLQVVLAFVIWIVGRAIIHAII